MLFRSSPSDLLLLRMYFVPMSSDVSVSGGSLPVSSVHTFVSLRVCNDCADASSSLLYRDDCSVILVFSQTSCGRISERNSVGLFLGYIVSLETSFHQLSWNDVPCATCQSGARVGFVGNLSKFSMFIFLKFFESFSSAVGSNRHFSKLSRSSNLLV